MIDGFWSVKEYAPIIFQRDCGSNGNGRKGILMVYWASYPHPDDLVDEIKYSAKRMGQAEMIDALDAALMHLDQLSDGNLEASLEQIADAAINQVNATGDHFVMKFAMVRSTSGYSLLDYYHACEPVFGRRYSQVHVPLSSGKLPTLTEAVRVSYITGNHGIARFLLDEFYGHRDVCRKQVNRLPDMSTVVRRYQAAQAVGTFIRDCIGVPVLGLHLDRIYNC